jgi:hypothetical protein
MENNKYKIFKAELKSSGEIYYGATLVNLNPPAWFNTMLAKARNKKFNNKDIGKYESLMIANPELDKWDLTLVNSELTDREAYSTRESLIKQVPKNLRLNTQSTSHVGSKGTPNDVEIYAKDVLPRKYNKPGEVWIKISALSKNPKIKVDNKQTMKIDGEIYAKVTNQYHTMKIKEDVKKQVKTIIENELNNMVKSLNENDTLEYNFKIENINFKVHFDVNKNPTKKGIKIQFKPMQSLENVDKNELMNRIQDELNKKLDPYQLEIDYDQDVPDKSIIGFYVKLGDLSNFFIAAFQK